MDVFDRIKFQGLSVWTKTPMDVLDTNKYQGRFGMDQLFQWTFWTGPNVLKTLTMQNSKHIDEFINTKQLILPGKTCLSLAHVLKAIGYTGLNRVQITIA